MSIEGRVIKIISSEDIIINVGKNDTVCEGMRFRIYSEHSGIQLQDPFASEEPKELGVLKYEKSKAEVTQVFDEYSILVPVIDVVTEEVEVRRPGLLSGNVFAQFGDRIEKKSSKKEIKHRLPIKKEDASREIFTGDKFIRIGDFVESED